MTDKKQKFDRKLCLYCTGFKVCEGLPAPMGWCEGKEFESMYGADYGDYEDD